MDTQNITYINILIDTLKHKIEILDALSKDTERQDELLSQEELDLEAFSKTIESKDKSLKELAVLDDGFTDIYKKVSAELKNNKDLYENEITYMQQLVRKVTDYSTSLTAAEERNKVRLSIHLTKSKQKIKEFKVSSRTAAAYYKNMSGKHQSESSYFYDKKK